MTRLDDAVERLARRMSVARLGLARGGPTPLLAPLVEPVIDTAQEVLRMAEMDLQPTFAAVDQPIGPATTDVLAEMVSERTDRQTMPDEVTLNRLAQTFYEASGISLPKMTDKPLVVKGLRAVFQRLSEMVPDADR